MYAKKKTFTDRITEIILYRNILGSYSCDIIPRTESSPNISILDTTVSVWAVVDSSEVAAEPVSIPFVPAVYLETEIVLGDSYSGELLVYGLNSVLDHVTVSDY